MQDCIKRKVYRYSKWAYSHLSNSRGGGNRQGGGTKVVKSINVEEGINEEVGFFWKFQ